MPNILLIGAADQTSAFIAELLPELDEPIELCQARDFRPPDRPGTLLLYDAIEMPAARQAALYEWLDNERGTRVVTTVHTPLFPRLEAGLFLTTLYYRLNIITIDLSVAAATKPGNLIGALPLSRRRPQRSAADRAR